MVTLSEKKKTLEVSIQNVRNIKLTPKQLASAQNIKVAWLDVEKEAQYLLQLYTDIHI